MTIDDLRPRALLTDIGVGVGLGAATGVAAVAYLAAEHQLHTSVWGHTERWDWFDGPISAIPILIAAGLIAAALRRWAKVPEHNAGFVDEMVDGRVEPRHAPALVALGLVSLTAGASVGPEGPLGTAGGAMGTWYAERRGHDDRVRTKETLAGISGAFGGLMTYPLVAPLMALELQRRADYRQYEMLFPSLVSATVAFAITFPVFGDQFFGVFEVEPFQFRSWMLAGGIALGLVGALLAMITGIVMRAAAKLADRVPSMFVRAAIGGAVLGVIGWVLPLTMFSGREELAIVLEQGSVIGSGLLVVAALAKIVTLAVSMRFGFFGGAIFPLIFVGGAAGVVVHDVWSAMPLAICVACVAGATAASLGGLPIGMTILVAAMFGISPSAGSPVLVSTLTAAIVVQLLRQRQARNDPSNQPGAGATHG